MIMHDLLRHIMTNSQGFMMALLGVALNPLPLYLCRRLTRVRPNLIVRLSVSESPYHM